MGHTTFELDSWMHPKTSRSANKTKLERRAMLRSKPVTLVTCNVTN